MYIAAARLYNFRSYRNENVDLGQGIIVLAGPNNAGKSNLVVALSLLFGERYPRRDQLAVSDFHVPVEGGQPATLLGIAGCLAGSGDGIVPGEDWGAYVEPWQPVDQETGQVIEPWTDVWWAALAEPPEGTRRWLRGDELLQTIRSASMEGEFWAYMVASRDESVEVDLGYLLRTNNQWQRLTRIRGAVRSGIMTAAHLPTFRSPTETLRVTDWSWYGKLVRKLYQKGRIGREGEFTQAERQLSHLVETSFQEPASQVEEALTPLISGVKVRFQAGPYTLDDAHKGVSLFVDDGVDAPFDEKGAGLQALLVVALFRCYCDEFHQASSVLLLEEPENYLHPHGRRALAASLRRFVDEAPRRRQVVISTHSETFVKLGGLDGLRLIRKRDGASLPLRVDATHEHVSRWRQILNADPECVFADHVILVEGGEVHLVPALANQVIGAGALDRDNVSVVRVEGKEDFKKHVTFLEELRIGWTILTDRDFLNRGWEQFQDRLPVGADAGNPQGLAQELERLGIFVNPRGCLEDLYTQQGHQYVKEHGKDRAALLIAREIEGGTPREAFFKDIAPFRATVERALRMVRERRGGPTEAAAVPGQAEPGMAASGEHDRA
ncbi:MAG: AAA family ATPase [Armatimonadota bacterium]|nr:AAA family ATPase [Armatimonadota bacterium]